MAATSVSRDWAAIYAALLTRPKYRRLSFELRGCLLHVWLLAGSTTPEATWARDELREILELDGAPDGALVALIAAGWLDEDGSTVTVHDWDEWQVAASRSIKNAWEAGRLRRWRRDHPAPPRTPPERRGQDKTGPGTTYVQVRTDGEPGGLADAPGVNCARCGQPTHGTRTIVVDRRGTAVHEACSPSEVRA
jgi:hypothetical protein